MMGFLFMWPALSTLVMFPVMLWTYRRLAIREEAAVAGRFGAIWEEYAETTPRFLPSSRGVGRGSVRGAALARHQPCSVERPRIDGR